MAESNPVELAAQMVAAFISYNPLPKSELPVLIQAVHSAVERLVNGPESAPLQVEVKAPAVPIRKSITPDYLRRQRFCGVHGGVRRRAVPLNALSVASSLARLASSGARRYL
jgi:hypothetical protein